MRPGTIIILVWCLALLGVSGVSGTSSYLTCWRNKIVAPCSEGNLTITYDLIGSRVESADRKVVYTVTIGDEFVSRLQGGSLQHANVHFCRKGSTGCTPFVADKLLITDTPTVIADIDERGVHDTANKVWNLTYETPVLLKAGTYDSFSHVYFNISNNTDGTGERIRWDVSRTVYIEIRFAYDIATRLIVILSWIFVVSCLVFFQRHAELVYEFDDEDTEVERNARENHAKNMKALTNRIRTSDDFTKQLMADKLSNANLSTSPSSRADGTMAKALQHKEVKLDFVQTLKKTPSGRNFVPAADENEEPVIQSSKSLPPEGSQRSFGWLDTSLRGTSTSRTAWGRRSVGSRLAPTLELANMFSPRSQKNSPAEKEIPMPSRSDTRPELGTRKPTIVLTHLADETPDEPPPEPAPATSDGQAGAAEESDPSVQGAETKEAASDEAASPASPGSNGGGRLRGATDGSLNVSADSASDVVVDLPSRFAGAVMSTSSTLSASGDLSESTPSQALPAKRPSLRSRSQPPSRSARMGGMLKPEAATTDRESIDWGESPPPPMLGGRLPMPFSRTASMGNVMPFGRAGRTASMEGGSSSNNNSSRPMLQKRFSIHRLASFTSRSPGGRGSAWSRRHLDKLDSREQGLELLREGRRDYYTTLASLYVWSALHSLPFVQDRPVYKYSTLIFTIYKSQSFTKFMCLVALAHMLLAFWEQPSMYSVDLDITQSANTATIESCFVSFYILDLGIRAYLMSTRWEGLLHHWGNTLYLTCIVWSLVDVLVAMLRQIVCNPTDMDGCPSIFIWFRVSRVLRPYFLIHHLDHLKADILKVGSSIAGVVDVFILGFGLLAIFGLFGYLNLSRCHEADDDCSVDHNDFNFESFGQALLALTVLLSTENIEVVWDNYLYRPGMIAYFMVYTAMCIFLLATFLSSIHSSFRHFRTVQVVSVLRSESINLAAAFESLDVEDSNLVSKEDWVRLIKKVKPKWDRDDAIKAFHTIDKNKDDLLELDEFVLACDVLRERPKSVIFELGTVFGMLLLKATNVARTCRHGGSHGSSTSGGSISGGTLVSPRGGVSYTSLEQAYPKTSHLFSRVEACLRASANCVRNAPRLYLPDSAAQILMNAALFMQTPLANAIELTICIANVITLGNIYDPDEPWTVLVDDMFALAACIHQLMRSAGLRSRHLKRRHAQADIAVVFASAPLMWFARAAGANWRLVMNLRALRSVRILTVAFDLSYSLQQEYLFVRDNQWSETSRESSFSDHSTVGRFEGFTRLCCCIAPKAAARLVYALDIKGLWTNIAQLLPVIQRQLAMCAVLIYPFAIVGMEMFAGKRADCGEDGNPYWYDCDDYEVHWTFENFPNACMTLYQVFYTGDIKELLKATSSGGNWYGSVSYWLLYYALIFVVIVDTLVSNVIEHFELVKTVLEERRVARTDRRRSLSGPQSSDGRGTFVKNTSFDDKTGRTIDSHTRMSEVINPDVYAEQARKRQFEKEMQATIDAADIRLQTAQATRINNPSGLARSERRPSLAGGASSRRSSIVRAGSSVRTVALISSRLRAHSEAARKRASSGDTTSLASSPDGAAEARVAADQAPSRLQRNESRRGVDGEGTASSTEPIHPPTIGEDRPASPEEQEYMNQSCWPATILSGDERDSEEEGAPSPSGTVRHQRLEQDLLVLSSTSPQMLGDSSPADSLTGLLENDTRESFENRSSSHL